MFQEGVGGQLEKRLDRQVGVGFTSPCVLGHGWWVCGRDIGQPLQCLKEVNDTEKGYEKMT